LNEFKDLIKKNKISTENDEIRKPQTLSLFDEIKFLSTDSKMNSTKKSQSLEIDNFFNYCDSYVSADNETASSLWPQIGSRFPNVSKIARKFLAIPATSCPVERLFKSAKVVIEDRQLLEPKKFECQTLIKNNGPNLTKLNFI
jgi:hypothetical protein